MGTRGTYLEQEEPASWTMSRMIAAAGLLDVSKGSAKRRSRSERPDEVRKMSACSSDTHDFTAPH